MRSSTARACLDTQLHYASAVDSLCSLGTIRGRKQGNTTALGEIMTAGALSGMSSLEHCQALSLERAAAVCLTEMLSVSVLPSCSENILVNLRPGSHNAHAATCHGMPWRSFRVKRADLSSKPALSLSFHAASPLERSGCSARSGY